MDCKAASNLVSGWLDGKLDCGEAAFLRHLNGCRACSLEINELQAVLAALRKNSVVVPAPEGFARHLKEDVSDEYGQKLEQYRQLAARAQEAEGAEAEELHLMINALLLELAGMHSTSGDMKAVTIWLES